MEEKTYDETFDNGKYHKPRIDELLHVLRSRQDDKARVLNIGSGPGASAGTFVTAVSPYCCKIILLEPNQVSCANYREMSWYEANKDKIVVMCGKIEDVLASGGIEDESVDYIFFEHVIYYWRLADIPFIVKGICKLMPVHTGRLFAGNTNENAPYIKQIKKFCPDYRHLRAFKEALDDAGLNYVVQTDIVSTRYSRHRELIALFLEGDVLRSKDYVNAGDGPLSLEHQEFCKSVADFIMERYSSPVPGSSDVICWNIMDYYEIWRTS